MFIYHRPSFKIGTSPCVRLAARSSSPHPGQRDFVTVDAQGFFLEKFITFEGHGSKWLNSQNEVEEEAPCRSSLGRSLTGVRAVNSATAKIVASEMPRTSMIELATAWLILPHLSRFGAPGLLPSAAPKMLMFSSPAP